MLTFLLSFPDRVYEIRSFVSSHMVKTSLGCPCFVSGYFFDTQPFKTMTIFTANGVFAFVCLPLRILAKKNAKWYVGPAGAGTGQFSSWSLSAGTGSGILWRI